jgi:hypothetical protein
LRVFLEVQRARHSAVHPLAVDAHSIFRDSLAIRIGFGLFEIDGQTTLREVDLKGI